jgi:predicted DNA-binding WGR domain protein
LVEGTSSKFWEVELEGSSVTTRYGRLGTQGQVTEKRLTDSASAQKLYDKLVREKVSKGYSLVRAAAKASKASPGAKKTSVSAKAPRASVATKKGSVPPARSTKPAETVLSLPVDKGLNAALRQAKLVALRPSYPLFEADFLGVWLFAKPVVRFMKGPKSGGAESSGRKASGSLRERFAGRPPTLEALAADTAFVKGLANALRGVVASSDIDTPYYPFAIHSPGAKRSDYFGVLEVGGMNFGLVRHLGDGEAFKMKDVTRQSLAFADFDDDEDPSESYDAKELRALAAATVMLKKHCGKVYELSLSQAKKGENAVPTYPVFTFGISPSGNVTGVFTLRCVT